MPEQESYRQRMMARYSGFLKQQALRFPKEETLRIDLHCHDYHSDNPDELWGRILRIPETWLPTEDLVSTLETNGADAITITNHNDARSCWDLKERGRDVLSGAEFTCTFPDLDMKIHVLVYGFTPEQETMLNKLRRDVYRFREYTASHDLPTVMPHPLYFYNPNDKPPMALFDRCALLFDRFEVLNGQRNIHQNLLTLDWLMTLTPDHIDQLGKQNGIRPDTFCKDPYNKGFTGGSDDHMGMFAGSCGTLLHVPNLQERLRHEKPSELALEAMRAGRTAPYGHVADEQKLSMAFMDYFCQIAVNMKDPGLVRMFLHNGTLKDKLWCLGISNAFHELKRHRFTMTFLRAFHGAMTGKKPSRLLSWTVSREHRPLLARLREISTARGMAAPEAYQDVLNNAIEGIYQHLLGILIKRLGNNYTQVSEAFNAIDQSPDELVRNFELPSEMRALFGNERVDTNPNMASVNLSNVFDNLSFPLLATGIMVGASFTGTRILNANNRFLNDFAERLGQDRIPGRMLWMTDTYKDRNGVSHTLQAMREEVARRNLPIDFLVCDPRVEPAPHLVVVPQITEVEIKSFGGHIMRIPDPRAIHAMFREGGYDRILCSTELAMGPLALLLKSAFNIPAYFYMHTDWLDYAARNTNLDQQGLDRVRRIIRGFYRRFDGVFVLNKEHREWLSSDAIGIKPERVKLTAHWVESPPPLPPARKSDIFPGVADTDHLLLFAGRLSEEKGVMDLPRVMELVRRRHPNTQLAFAGTGPAENELRKAMPEALFMGWVSQDVLGQAYAAADLLVLPSRFDTFGRVVLEAMSRSCPVVAYNTKGPRDIVRDGVNGFLSDRAEDMAADIIGYLGQPAAWKAFRDNARDRCNAYRPDEIVANLLRDVGLSETEGVQLDPTVEEDAMSDDEGFMADLLEIVS